jgi:hypothetical protein
MAHPFPDRPRVQKSEAHNLSQLFRSRHYLNLYIVNNREKISVLTAIQSIKWLATPRLLISFYQITEKGVKNGQAGAKSSDGHRRGSNDDMFPAQVFATVIAQ